jgi:hypothetical protein
VSAVAVPARLSVVPSPHWTVTLVGEFVVEKLTVTVWSTSAGFGESEVIVTVGTLTTAGFTVMLVEPVLPLWAVSPG